MKKIVKLRLINWHLFFNETTDIDDITFLTGANGTGKSTIIDAMQILLLGDTSGRNFNKAANDKTGRTLRGYLRGELGETADGKIMALRPGRFTSYVAMEFYDDSSDSSFTLGIVFDCFEGDSEEHHFFFIKDKFPTNNFTNREMIDKEQPRPLAYKELSKFLSETYQPSQFKFFDSNTMYQNFIKEELGNLPDKYFTLFKKAVSFSPITNISNFITEFVCDIDYNIDIEPMRQNIEQYKLLELEAKRIQTKVDALNGIKEAYESFRKNIDSMSLANYVITRARFEAYKQEIDQYEKNLSDKKQRKDEINQKLIENDVQIKELKSDKEQYLAKKVGSSGYSLSSSLISKKNQALEKIQTIEQNYQTMTATITSSINDYESIIKRIQSRLSSFDDSFLTDDEQNMLDEFKNIQNEFAQTIFEVKSAINSKSLSAEIIKELQAEMSSYHSYASKMIRTLETSVFNLQGNISSLDMELREINSGRKPFKNIYLEVKSALENDLKLKYPHAKVETYCDLVDIRDKKWTKSIEAAIFNQKFNFFVEKDYYEEAAKCLARIAREYNYYNISVVDTAKLIDRNFEANPNSVAEEIITDHEGARAYTNFLLGRIKKCDTFAEARESGNGLLANCTGYRNFASWYLNIKLAEVSFIGTKLDNSTILAKKDEFSSYNKDFEKYNELLNYFNSIALIEVINTTQARTFAADINDYSPKMKTLDDEVERYEQELEEGSLGEVNDFDKKITAIDEDIASIENESNNLRVQLGGIETQILQLENELIPNKRNLLSHQGVELQKFDAALVEEKFDPFFANAMENLSLNQIVTDAQTHYVQTQNKLGASKSRLMDLRSKYVATYNLSYDVTKENTNEEFDSELTNLETVLLPTYASKIDSAHKKAIKEFKDDFIYKLRTSFETIKAQIDDLNTALKEVKFGRDSYRFSVEPNKDYMNYYNMITDDLLLNVGDAEDIYLEKYKDSMADLFNMISDSTDQSGDVKAQILENIQKFTDYRTYLIFDLLVRRGENEVESSLARTFKRQSGGETQTPFYISILASFAQLYRCQDQSNNDTLRLVIFDEAFSKMDGSRIKEAVGLLRSFGLQAILSTPSEKLRDLSKEVDLVLVAIHDTKKNRSYLDKYQEVKRIN